MDHTKPIMEGETVINGSSLSRSLMREGDFEELGVNSVLRLILSRSCVNEKVHIKNPKNVEKLIEELISAGPNSLQVITDFDATLSRYHKDGKKCNTSYGVIAGSRFVPNDVRARGAALYQKYYPYESDLTISAEERIAKLAEWYDLKHENYLNSGVSLKSTDLADLVKETDLILRDGSQEMLQSLHSANIPTIIFSAGNGNSIVELLKFNQVYFPNIQIISNFIVFDETTKEFKGFNKPYIHPGNKNQGIILELNPQHFDNMKERRTAIVLGDNFVDPEMADGLPESNSVLKIGFLNYNFEQQLEAFKDAFDIVLVDDQTMHLPQALLQLILKDLKTS